MSIEETPIEEREDLITRAVALMCKASFVIVCSSADAESTNIDVSTIGIHGADVVDALRDFADKIEAELLRAELLRAGLSVPVMTIPDPPGDGYRKTQCPGCSEPLYITKDLPDFAIQRNHSCTTCICACGAVLLVFLNDDGSARCRFMTELERLSAPPEMQARIEQLRSELMNARKK